MNGVLSCVPTWHETLYFIGGIGISRGFGDFWSMVILYGVILIITIRIQQSLTSPTADIEVTTIQTHAIHEVETKDDIDDATGIDAVSMDDATMDQTYPYPIKPTPDQTRKMLDILHKEHLNDFEFFKSTAYLDLIPTDSDWIKRTPKLKNATQTQHEQMLNSFVIPDAPFAYKKDVEAAMQLFNEWRSWENGKEWIQKGVKGDMTIYARSVPGEPIDIIKGEGAVYPYPSSIVLGVLINVYHRKQWDEKLDKLIKIKRCSEFSALIYCTIKTPTIFISDRDVLAVAFVYPFEDGSVIMGTRSVQHRDYPPNKGDKVRAIVNGDFWYITPDFENNINHSKVTLYSHVNVGGQLPAWLINLTSTEVPLSILKVRKYMESVYNTLHEKGSLHIPPFPCLKSLDIDIGWMDRESASRNEEKEEEEQKDVKSINIDTVLFDYPDLCVRNDTDQLISLLKQLSTDMDTALQAISAAF